MVACKFFQQGNCRFGQSCRFEHIYGSKYSYHAQQPAQSSSAPSAVTDEQLINQVHADIQSALQGGQWLLSGYAPFKEKATMPGLIDLSPEEVRLFFYEARNNNNLEQAMAYMTNVFKEARSKYEQLLQKTSRMCAVFRGIYKGEHVSSPFDSQAQGFNDASSVFRSAVQDPATYNQAPSIFQNNSMTNSSTAFAQNPQSVFSQSDPAKSIFAQANQSSFANNQSSVFAMQSSDQPNVFGPQTETAKSLFSQATQNTFTQAPANLFANASKSIFSASQQTASQTPSNVFQNQMNENNFNQNMMQSVAGEDLNIYSKMEDISVEDMEAFRRDEFKLGFVPEVPPPRSLCI